MYTFIHSFINPYVQCYHSEVTARVTKLCHTELIVLYIHMLYYSNYVSHIKTYTGLAL